MAKTGLTNESSSPENISFNNSKVDFSENSNLDSLFSKEDK